MNTFQMIAVPLTLLASLRYVLRSFRGRGRYARMTNAVLAFVWALASVLIISPKLTSVMAESLGIGRGTDLILYLFIILAVCYAIFIYYRLCDMRRDITLIVRHIAITERQVPTGKEQSNREESSTPQPQEG